MTEEHVRFYPKMSSLVDDASNDSQLDLARAMQSRSQTAQTDAGAHAGPGADQTRLEPSTCVEAETFALRVLDDTMQPEFRKGCIILIDPTGRAKDGCYVLAKITANKDDEHQNLSNSEPDDEAVLEQYLFRQLKQNDNKQWYLQALNEEYQLDTIEIDLQDVEGVIVQRAGTRRSYHKHYD